MIVECLNCGRVGNSLESFGVKRCPECGSSAVQPITQTQPAATNTNATAKTETAATITKEEIRRLANELKKAIQDYDLLVRAIKEGKEISEIKAIGFSMAKRIVDTERLV